jgi:hypothetical protein
MAITARNSVASVTQNFGLTVAQAPAITSAASATATVGSVFSFLVTWTGSPVPTVTPRHQPGRGRRAGGITQGRVSAIEHAKPGTTELRTLAAYVEALGGRLEIIADFGNQRLTFTEPGTKAA